MGVEWKPSYLIGAYGMFWDRSSVDWRWGRTRRFPARSPCRASPTALVLLRIRSVLLLLEALDELEGDPKP